MTRRLLALALSLVSVSSFLLTASPAGAAQACINNDCPTNQAGFAYHGGTLITTPHVYVVRFSDSASVLSPTSGYPAQTFSATAPNLSGAINAIVVDPATTWWMSEYSTPAYQLTPGSYGGVVTLLDPALADNANVTDAQLQAALSAAMDAGTLPDTSANAIYVALLRTTQTVSSPYGACPYHGHFNSVSQGINVNFAVLGNYGAGTRCIYASPFTPFDNMTELLSATLIDMITDPGPPFGWATSVGLEMASICAYSPAPYDGTMVHYQGAAYDLKNIWSRQVDACLSTVLPTALSATLVSPTSASISLHARGVPLYNQVVAIDAGTTQLTSGRTNSNGNLTLNFPAQPAGTKLSAVLAPVPALEPAHADLTAPSSATITTDAPALVAAGRYFSFSVRLTPAAQVPITVSGPHYSFTAKLDNNGVAIVRTLVPLGVTVLTVSTKNPIARTSFKVRGANPPTLKLTETSPQSLRATLTGPGPIANAHLSATPAGYTNVVPATTNAAGNAKFSFILLGASSSLIRVSYPGSATALPTSQTLRLTPLDSLGTGQILTPGTSRTSANGNYVLHLSTSGDLLLSRGSKTIWQTGTTCTSPHLVMLASGNAVLENAKGQAVWQTHTSGSPVMMLTVSNRGTVLATSDTKDYWTSVSPHGGRLL